MQRARQAILEGDFARFRDQELRRWPAPETEEKAEKEESAAAGKAD